MHIVSNVRLPRSSCDSTASSDTCISDALGAATRAVCEAPPPHAPTHSAMATSAVALPYIGLSLLLEFGDRTPRTTTAVRSGVLDRDSPRSSRTTTMGPHHPQPGCATAGNPFS